MGRAVNRLDADLVMAACNGDVDSFRELFNRHQKLALGLARSLLPDSHLAEDAVQEAFAIVCQNLWSLRDGSRFPQWLGTIVRNCARKLSKSQGKTRELVAEPIAPSNDLTSTQSKLDAALAQLPESAREVIHLHYFSELSYDQIAQVLSTSPQAVHGRLQRARRALLELLTKSETYEVKNERTA